LDAWTRGHRFAMDSLTTGFLCLFLAFPYALAGSAVPFVWSLVLLAPLAWRRTHPVLSSAAICFLALQQWLQANPNTFTVLYLPGSSAGSLALLPADVVVPITVHAATCYAPVWGRRTALLSGLLGAFLQALQLNQYEPGITDILFIFFLFASSVVGAWAIGSMQRARLDHVDSLRERARLLEVERDQKARLAVTAERSRIAREMHDVVAHSLAVMIAQADGGRYSVRSAPDTTEQVLQTIGDTGRKALAEMRQLLAVLRTDLGDSWEPEASQPSPISGAGPYVPWSRPISFLRSLFGSRFLPPGTVGDGAPFEGNTRPVRLDPTAAFPTGRTPDQTDCAPAPQLRPQPRLPDLESLVEDVRSSGQQVELSMTGPARDVVPGFELAAYRIVQESLTNVLKHAGPGVRTRVSLRWSAEALHIEVVDDGRGAGAAVLNDGRGMGLMGMQERASVFGGKVRAAPVVGGGFRVEATIPLLPALTD
jgi:signal transduction histidine kinase